MSITEEHWKAEKARKDSPYSYKLYRMVGVFLGVFANIEFTNS